jgi:putative ABC transport system permease protein
MGLRSVPARFGTSAVIVVGIAAVVAVLVSALSIAHGFTRAALATGNRSRAVVLNGSTESDSQVSQANFATVAGLPGIRRGSAGQPIVSAETVVFVPTTDRHTGLNAYVVIRGVGPQAFVLRPEIKLVAGRMFRRGAHELIVGRGVQRRLGSLEVGSNLTLPNGEWQVVGAFESAGDAHESELMTAADTLLDAYRHSGYNSVTVALEGADAFERLKAALAANPALSASAQREDEYYAAESGPISTMLLVLAYGIGGIMAFGAIWGALNTMYSAVSTRVIEIATLRAIGFGAAAVVVSVLAEALTLGLVGAALGAGLAWALLDSSTISTMTGVTPSQLTFGLRVGPGLVMVGVGFALVIAVVGGFFAAMRAARLPVSAALRLV